MWFKAMCVGALLAASADAAAQVSLQVGLPSVRIGVHLGGYPDLVAVPGYPVYYAPGVESNLFFYDGLYWVYSQDGWYSSSWYDGPWDRMDRDSVPLYVLRVPVRYYPLPPPYFSGWGRDAPPRWGEHWGNGWERRHDGWDRWDRRSAPAAAPLPTYQQAYVGNRYPTPDRQRALRASNYHYQPREAVARQQYGANRQAAAPDRPASMARPAPRPPTVDERRNAPVARADRPPPGARPDGRPASPDASRTAVAPAPNRGSPPTERPNRGAPPSTSSPETRRRGNDAPRQDPAPATQRPAPARRDDHPPVERERSAPPREPPPPRAAERAERPRDTARRPEQRAEPERERDH